MASATFRQIFRSSAIEGRVIHALLLREMLTRFGRHNIGFLWLFVEPMLFTIGVTVLWSVTKSFHGSSLPIAAFALSGYSAVLLWRNMPTRCIGAIEPNLSLMYHRNVKVVDIFISRLILEGGGATISFVVLSIVFMTLGMIDPPENVLQVLGGWLMTAWFGVSLAVFLGSLAQDSELVEKLWHPAAYLLFPLSGAAFLVDALPPVAQHYLLYLPMVHGTEFIREGYFGSRIRAHYDLEYMAFVNSLLLLLAMAQLRKVSRQVIPE
jgi:ABC-2 type transport system permease protein/capsular polysaccharide transport system permease protein